MNVKCLVLSLLIVFLTGCSLPRIIVLNDPLDAGQHNDLGVSYEHRGEYDLALREYQRAAELDQDWALPLFNMGNVYSRREEWPDAVAAYEAALGREPQTLQVMNNLAWALIASDELERGVSLAEEVVALDETRPAYWDTLAAAYQAVGRGEDARRAAARGLALEPSDALKAELETKLYDGVADQIPDD